MISIRKSNGLRFEPDQTTALGNTFGAKKPSTLTCITLPTKKIREPSAKLCRQIRMINFVPKSIVPNIVKCFLDIKEGRY